MRYPRYLFIFAKIFRFRAILTAFVQTHVVKILTLRFECAFEEIGEGMVLMLNMSIVFFTLKKTIFLRI